ncbi:hypothetical protein [Hymenobacter cavernae]|uniref:Uncharacterized protein n=1 Tax=Hymenobacter cavernae TaxID=2044852 RepID=A0ABQ1TY59_9BACT|nr:hypothetical protein [Hymenobacter cavernae]GGF05756.1 hypothetical protein GCM10011383_16080 [Hymenobacter cavernae]
MLTLKRIVNVVAMVYLLLALLFVFSPATRDTFASALGLNTAGTIGNPDSAYNLATFYNTLFITGLVLLALELLVENVHNLGLHRDISRHESKVNELKAKLYDHQMEQRDRELQQRSVTAAPVAAPAPTTTPASHSPMFPQQDPGLANAPMEKPNVIIPPAPAPGHDNRPTL